MKKCSFFFLFYLVHLHLLAQSWKMASMPLQTPWADQLNPQDVLPEYPRPIMERKDWLNLNGVWEFQEDEPGLNLFGSKPFKDKILVPFPWESGLSGIRKQFAKGRAHYRRRFSTPGTWKEQRVLLHFGAVDWEASVYVNGRCVGTHRGGYDAFSFDVSSALKPEGDNELLVSVYDPGSAEGIAVGKQSNERFNDPQRYSYAPASGIWQTVWLEPVPKQYIQDFHLTPDIDQELIQVLVNPAQQLGRRWQAEVVVLDGTKEIARGLGPLNEAFNLSLPQPKLWSPQSPFLYTVRILLRDSTQVIDQVATYVGMRKISLLPYKGQPRLALNNQFLFQFGPLDQGYWPDGIYTAPSDEALKWDIEQIKNWGFNMVRKHIKVEPQRWYYWCDKMGILVWQDMPSTFKKRSEAEKTQFESELQHMVKSHWNHPSIVNWVVFNEHWGLYDVERLTKMVMDLDPSRLVTGNSGIDAGNPNVDYEVGHLKDNHSYRPPSCPLGSNLRAIANGEYGAIGYNVPGHIWDTDGPWVHYNYAGLEAATLEYEKFIEMITTKFQKEGLSAAVYTQWTDVENEMNGLYTYDRKVIKLDKDRVKKANLSTWSSDRMKQ